MLCLHCTIKAAIEAYFEEVGERQGDQVLMDSSVILDALVDIMAEVLACEEDEKLRAAICLHFTALALRHAKAGGPDGHAAPAGMKPH